MDWKFERLVIATHNPAKVSRYGALLAKYAHAVIGLPPVDVIGKPDECGETAEENAAIKAGYYAERMGAAVFSEDEALYVDFLPPGDQPGVHVRRINGRDEADDAELFSYWQKLIADVPPARRTGRWHVAYCIARPDGPARTFSQDFPIVFFSPASPVIIPGWPMSSLEGPAELQKPHSELTAEERHQADGRIDRAIARAIAGMVA